MQHPLNGLWCRSVVAAGVLFLSALGLRVHAEDKPLTRVRVGYFGNSCEGHFFVAKELGFWKEEGLDVELIKGDPTTLREAVAFGKIDATDGMLMQWVKPMESGLDAKFTAGIHTGCIQTIVRVDSQIKVVTDLKGKIIGVPAIGGGPMILTSRALFLAGIDPKRDVIWKVFPYSELPLVLAKGYVDSIALADPLPQSLVEAGKARKLINQATDEPFKDEYCCLLIINGRLIREKPEIAAAITRGVLRGAVHIMNHPEDSAKLGVKKKYVPGTVALNGACVSTYCYRPSIRKLEGVLAKASAQLKEIGILNKKTDPKKLAEGSFATLPGVDEDYIKKTSRRRCQGESPGRGDSRTGLLPQ